MQEPTEAEQAAEAAMLEHDTEADGMTVTVDAHTAVAVMVAQCREALVENAHRFTCSEANAMREFLLLWADASVADDFAVSHAEGDEPGDDHYEIAVEFCNGPTCSEGICEICHGSGVTGSDGGYTHVEVDGVVVAETRRVQL